MMKRKKRRTRNKRLTWIPTLIVCAAMALSLWLGMRLGSGWSQQSAAPTASPEAIATQATPRLTADPNAGARITPLPAPTLPGIAIPGWGSIRLPAGVTEAPVALNNPEANAGWYDMTFELRLKETDEVIFTTGLVSPGQYCNQVTLNRPLEAGEYAAILHVQPYMQDENQTPTNNADMETTLFVE